MPASRRWRAGAVIGAAGLGAGLAVAALVSPAVAAPPNCTVASLARTGVGGVAIQSAVAVAAAGSTPEYCDVKGAVATDGDGAGPGSALFELKLPARWNNRFVFFGCGGNCGSLANVSANRHDVAAALGLGYAAVNTDTGHEQSRATPDPTWALAAPGVANAPAVADFYYRAVHQVTQAAKDLVAGYYGGTIRYSYFDGCSTGGRQSLMEGERYPDDFDGLIAADAVMSLSYQRASTIKQALTFVRPEAYIPFATLDQVNKAVIAACDAADGVTDGLIQNPARCDFDPASLVPDTLTKPQADALKAYLGMVHDPQGTPIYPGMPVTDLPSAGFEGQAEAPVAASDPAAVQPWDSFDQAPRAWQLGDAGIRYYIARDAAFDVGKSWQQAGNVVPDATLALLRERSGAGDSDDPAKLDQFLRRGGKLIMYHGYSDPLVSPYRSIWFYEELAELNGGMSKIDDRARLFMVPGMGHCHGGPGPDDFDTLSALDHWVTDGGAPDAIVAKNAASGRTMPLCKYPEEARYKGAGDVDDAANWSCPANDRRMLETGTDGKLSGMGGPALKFLHDPLGLGH